MKKGIALIITILSLMVLSILSVGLIMMTTMESQITSFHIRSIQSLEYAQAGFNEIISRMGSTDPSIYIGENSEIPDPNWVTIVTSNVITDSDSTDNIHFKQSIAPDSIASHFSGTSVTSDPSTWEDAIVVKYKTNDDTTQIYFYDPVSGGQILGPPQMVGKYFPVMEVYITGRTNNGARKTIKAEIAKAQFVTEIPASLSGKSMGVSLRGKADLYVCGHNHTDDGTWPGIVINTGGGGGGGGSSTPVAVYGWPECSPYHYTRNDSSAHPQVIIEYDSLCNYVGCVPGIKTNDISILERGHWTDVEIHGNPDVVYSPNFIPDPLWKILAYEDSMTLENEISTNKWVKVTSFPNDSATDTFYVCMGNFNLNDAPSMPTPGVGFDAAAPATQINQYAKGVFWIRGDMEWNIAKNYAIYFKGITYVNGDIVEITPSRGGRAVYWNKGTFICRGEIDANLKGRKKFIFLYSSEITNKTREKLQSRGYKVIGWRETAE